MKWRGKRDIPEKTRQPDASSGTIYTFKKSGMNRPEIEPAPPRWEASSLTAWPPWPRGYVEKGLRNGERKVKRGSRDRHAHPWWRAWRTNHSAGRTRKERAARITLSSRGMSPTPWGCPPHTRATFFPGAGGEFKKSGVGRGADSRRRWDSIMQIKKPPRALRAIYQPGLFFGIGHSRWREKAIFGTAGLHSAHSPPYAPSLLGSPKAPTPLPSPRDGDYFRQIAHTNDNPQMSNAFPAHTDRSSIGAKWSAIPRLSSPVIFLLAFIALAFRVLLGWLALKLLLRSPRKSKPRDYNLDVASLQHAFKKLLDGRLRTASDIRLAREGEVNPRLALDPKMKRWYDNSSSFAFLITDGEWGTRRAGTSEGTVGIYTVSRGREREGASANRKKGREEKAARGKRRRTRGCEGRHDSNGERELVGSSFETSQTLWSATRLFRCKILYRRPSVLHSKTYEIVMADRVIFLAERERVIEVSMEHRRNERTGETGDPREKPPINGIVLLDSHMRKSGSTRPGIESRSTRWEATS
ncbi:hypothetical protein PR048_019553 [Dryococelus australis]|uniref:Uncharacterized protein n=1 Tax=Dryococelus australis TaxID=614101 RepID=A0ABQ9H3W7_9NEOP|nr:hypothetical protein PR048_019553 [Dryococelus australis]